MLLKQPYIGPKSIIFEVISVISVVISVIPVISVNRRTGSRACVPGHVATKPSRTGTFRPTFWDSSS